MESKLHQLEHVMTDDVSTCSVYSDVHTEPATIYLPVLVGVCCCVVFVEKIAHGLFFVFFFFFSIRFSHSVQHMKVVTLPDGRYRFGHSNFEGVNNFKKHFEQEKPNVGGDSGKSGFLQ